MLAPASVSDRSATTPPASSASGATATSVASDKGGGPTAPAAPTGDVVAGHAAGDGATPSEVHFVVSGQWELRWHVDGAGNGVAATVDDDQGNQRLFAGLTPGDGSLPVADGCTCTLHLSPDGSGYVVDVVDVVD